MATLTDRGELVKDYAVEARLGILKASVHILADHPTGVGLGNFTKAIGPYDPEFYNRTSHNTFVTCFVELGVFGGLLFLSIIGGSVLLLLRTSRIVNLTDDPARTRYIVYGLMISLVTYVVTGVGTERFSSESYWWVLALPLCANRMAAGEAYKTADVPALVQAQNANDGAFSWGRAPSGA